jgi:hypothetical protein
VDGTNRRNGEPEMNIFISDQRAADIEDAVWKWDTLADRMAKEAAEDERGHRRELAAIGRRTEARCRANADRLRTIFADIV